MYTAIITSTARTERSTDGGGSGGLEPSEWTFTETVTTAASTPSPPLPTTSRRLDGTSSPPDRARTDRTTTPPAPPPPGWGRTSPSRGDGDGRTTTPRRATTVSRGRPPPYDDNRKPYIVSPIGRIEVRHDANFIMLSVCLSVSNVGRLIVITWGNNKWKSVHDRIDRCLGYTWIPKPTRIVSCDPEFYP